MKASIIIRAKDESEYIGQTLEQIQRQVLDGQYEIIIVDSGSTDGTLEIVSRYPVRLVKIPPTAFTYGYALNVGAREAVGEYLVNLSAHCIPVDDHWLAELVRPLEAHSSVIATFGSQVPIKGINPYEEVKLAQIFPSSGQAVEAQKAFSNSNCAIRKRVWEATPFDKDISIMEDKMWYLEVKDQGDVVYVPRAAVYHSHKLNYHFVISRAFMDGLAHIYAEKVFELDISPHDYTRRGWLRRAFYEHRHWIRFLVKNRYWLHLLSYFPYQIFHRRAFERGLREGRRRFAHGHSQGQSRERE